MKTPGTIPLGKRYEVDTSYLAGTLQNVLQVSQVRTTRAEWGCMMWICEPKDALDTDLFTESDLGR